jgi:hypothetical protein
MIGFNTSKYPQYTRPSNPYLTFLQPTHHTLNGNTNPNFFVPSQTVPNSTNSAIHSPSKEYKIIDSSKKSQSEMAELNKDLDKLKEQLRRLSND